MSLSFLLVSSWFFFFLCAWGVLVSVNSCMRAHVWNDVVICSFRDFCVVFTYPASYRFLFRLEVLKIRPFPVPQTKPFCIYGFNLYFISYMCVCLMSPSFQIWACVGFSPPFKSMAQLHVLLVFVFDRLRHCHQPNVVSIVVIAILLSGIISNLNILGSDEFYRAWHYRKTNILNIVIPIWSILCDSFNAVSYNILLHLVCFFAILIVMVCILNNYIPCPANPDLCHIHNNESSSFHFYSISKEEVPHEKLLSKNCCLRVFYPSLQSWPPSLGLINFLAKDR